MDGQELFHRFDLYDEGAFEEEIDYITFCKMYPFVVKR
jgi:hypothetical protein